MTKTKLTKAQENILSVAKCYGKDAEFTGRQLRSIRILEEDGIVKNVQVSIDTVFSNSGRGYHYSESTYKVKVITFELV
jgi:hypothetical protein